MRVLTRRDFRENHKFRPVPLTAFLCLVLAVWIFPSQEAGADDTGLKVATAIVSTGSWSSFTAGQLNADDDNRATVSSNLSYGVISTFAFGVPAAKAIDGIEVQFEASSGGSSWVTAGIQLSWDAGTTWTTGKTHAK